VKGFILSRRGQRIAARAIARERMNTKSTRKVSLVISTSRETLSMPDSLYILWKRGRGEPPVMCLKWEGNNSASAFLEQADCCRGRLQRPVDLQGPVG
jgi:hypothetical protein